MTLRLPALRPVARLLWWLADAAERIGGCPRPVSAPGSAADHPGPDRYRASTPAPSRPGWWLVYAVGDDVVEVEGVGTVVPWGGALHLDDADDVRQLAAAWRPAWWATRMTEADRG